MLEDLQADLAAATGVSDTRASDAARSMGLASHFADALRRRASKTRPGLSFVDHAADLATGTGPVADAARAAAGSGSNSPPHMHPPSRTATVRHGSLPSRRICGSVNCGGHSPGGCLRKGSLLGGGDSSPLSHSPPSRAVPSELGRPERAVSADGSTAPCPPRPDRATSVPTALPSGLPVGAPPPTPPLQRPGPAANVVDALRAVSADNQRM
eukprot:5144778-Prymnesium_polylepis.1